VSRGLGRMQLAVLAELREETARLKYIWDGDNPPNKGDPQQARRWHGLRKIGSHISGRKLDPELLSADHSYVESVRRAIKSLEQRGLVEVAYLWYEDRSRNHDHEWSALTNGPGLHCRLSDEEYARLEPIPLSVPRKR
jgi:hypothetical protein